MSGADKPFKIPKSITIFGHEVRLRSGRGRLGDTMIEVDTTWSFGKPRVQIDTGFMYAGRREGKTFDAAARKAEKAFLKAAAKRIEKNAAETRALKSALRKFGGAK